MSHLHEPVRQGVLEVPAHEFEDLEAHLFPDLGAGGLVLEEHMRVADVKDAARRNGDEEDILPDVVECFATAADVANIDDPVGIPDAQRPSCLSNSMNLAR